MAGERKILNVGCGGQTYGTHFLDVYPSRNEVKKWDAEKGIPFKNDFFDEVYSRNLFEHLKNPNFVLKEMFRVTKPNGKVVLITDNASYWVWSIPNKVHTGLYEKYSGPKDRHYSLFTDTHLKNHMEAAGAKRFTVSYRPDPYPSMTWAKYILREIITRTLRLTPVWRMGYGRVVAVGIKGDNLPKSHK
jgi:SAM-dependent methyltransferase